MENEEYLLQRTVLISIGYDGRLFEMSVQNNPSLGRLALIIEQPECSGFYRCFEFIISSR